MPGGRLVDGEFILNDADEGGGPSQPEVISPHGDRAQCECVHLVTIQRWDPEADAVLSAEADDEVHNVCG